MLWRCVPESPCSLPSGEHLVLRLPRLQFRPTSVQSRQSGLARTPPRFDDASLNGKRQLRIFLAARQREMRGESRPLSRRTLDGEPAPMSIEDVLDQSKPESGTALRAALCNIDAIEPFRQPRQMLWCNT